MVEFGLVRLDFQKVPVVEIARSPQVSVPEYDYSSASVPNSEVLACLIEINWSQDICFSDLVRVPLSEPINVGPLWSHVSIGRVLRQTSFGSSFVLSLLWLFTLFLCLSSGVRTRQWNSILAATIESVVLRRINLHLYGCYQALMFLNLLFYYRTFID